MPGSNQHRESELDFVTTGELVEELKRRHDGIVIITANGGVRPKGEVPATVIWKGNLIFAYSATSWAWGFFGGMLYGQGSGSDN